MKKLLTLTLLLSISIVSLFGQNFIGDTKKSMMEQFKKTAISIGKPQKIDKDYYSIEVKFENSKVYYSFTNEDYCYSYILVSEWNADFYSLLVKDYDNKYLRAFDNKTDIWKEYKGGTFVYRWIVNNYNKNTMYILFITKENYDNFRYQYLQQLLGS